MRKNHTGVNKKNTLVTGIVTGILTALLVTVALSAGMTSLILNGTLELDSAGFLIFIIRALSSLLGCLIAVIIGKERMLQTIGLTALGYLIVLLAMGIVFFDGSFQHFGSGIMSILIGAASVFLIKMMKINNSKQTKHRYK